jgi:hypothetical protein
MNTVVKSPAIGTIPFKNEMISHFLGYGSTVLVKFAADSFK